MHDHWLVGGINRFINNIVDMTNAMSFHYFINLGSSSSGPQRTYTGDNNTFTDLSARDVEFRNQGGDDPPYEGNDTFGISIADWITLTSQEANTIINE